MLFSITHLFQVDTLSWIMASLISLVLITVSVFSKRYMAGDRYYSRHRILIAILGLCLLTTVFSDNIWLFLTGWGVSNLLLVRLMIHKKEWQAAKNSGILTLANFGLGFCSLAAAAWLLAESSQTASIHKILAQSHVIVPAKMTLALSLIAIAAMTQSAVWPFHKWLISSLNSPTPVSALMHAGLVNGGGFLLVRFAPLFLMQPLLLKVLFIAGIFTALLGTLWKLIQPDIKRMLACSTMAQMGFMLAECGMGLFAPAVSHLVWHGLFKAYQFLKSGSALQATDTKISAGTNNPVCFLIACFLGLGGAFAFSLAAQLPLVSGGTGLVLSIVAFMTSAQVACTVLNRLSVSKVLIALSASTFSGFLYGGSIRMFEVLLSPLHLWRPQPLDAVYLSGSFLLCVAWALMNVNQVWNLQNSTVWKRLYVAALNGSRPHPKTVTPNRMHYKF